MAPAMMRYFVWSEAHVPWTSALSSTFVEGSEGEGGPIVPVGPLGTVDKVVGGEVVADGEVEGEEGFNVVAVGAPISERIGAFHLHKLL